MKKFFEHLQSLQRYVDQWWYLPLMALIAGLNHYLIIFPVGAMAVSSVLIHRKNWFSISVWFASGSTIGAFSIAYITFLWGPQFIGVHFPIWVQSSYWTWAQTFFTNYGLWLVLLSALTPVPQQPAMVISALAQASLWQIGLMLTVGRLCKFVLIGYLASHAPEKLQKFWTLRKELEDLHVPVE